MLLIIDNCEHLLEACAHLADSLLKNCPNLKILATSREALYIAGEAQYRVPSLALPEAQEFLEQLLECESIQLFAERGKLVQEDFSLTMENAVSIAQICLRLDGIPLAIELAAARVNLLSTEQIAARLNDSFNLLTGGSRTTLPRHQTLRASIDWSWNLLSESEQILLRRLAIFAGGCTLDAAESVCAGNGIERQQVMETLGQVVAKSLVVVNPIGEQERRYRLLEMVRQYAQEKFVEAGEEEDIRTQHLEYFLILSEQIEQELIGPRQMEWFAHANSERDNLRAALEHAGRIDVQAGLYISSRLKNFWEYFDYSEGARWLAGLLQKPESKDYHLARTRALCVLGWFMALANQFDAADSAAQECLALSHTWRDQYGEVDGLNLLTFIANIAGRGEPDPQAAALALARSLGDIGRQATALYNMGLDHRDLKHAAACWDEAIKLYREAGNWRPLANTLSSMGAFLVKDGNPEAAQKYLEEATRLYEQFNIGADERNLFNVYGQIALMEGDYERAYAYFRENAEAAKEVGNRIDYLWGNLRLGQVALRQGKITEAHSIFIETAQEFQKDGYKEGVVFSLECMATLYSALDKAENAARLIGWADATREVIGDTRPFLEQADVDRDSAASVTRIGKAAFREAYDQGRAMLADEAVAYALEAG